MLAVACGLWLGSCRLLLLFLLPVAYCLLPALLPVLPIAVQLPIKVHDTAAAIVPIIQLTPYPATVAGLALRAQCVTMHMNLAASLHIGASRHITPSGPSAFEAPLIINNVANAPLVVIQRSVVPAAVTGLATRAQRVAIHADIAAALCIGSTRWIATVPVTIPIIVPASGPVTPAPQLSIGIADAIATPVEVAERSINPLPIHVLAARPQSVIAHTHVLARLEISPVWRSIVLATRKLPIDVGDVSNAAVHIVKLRPDPLISGGFTLGAQTVAAQFDVPARLLVAAWRNVCRCSGKNHGPHKKSQHYGMPHVLTSAPSLNSGRRVCTAFLLRSAQVIKPKALSHRTGTRRTCLRSDVV